MSTSPSDRRRSVAVAMQRASQVTNISLQMVLPGLVGYWLDTKWGTSPWILLVLTSFGLMSGMRALIRLADGSGSSRAKRAKSGQVDSVGQADSVRADSVRADSVGAEGANGSRSEPLPESGPPSASVPPEDRDD